LCQAIRHHFQVYFTKENVSKEVETLESLPKSYECPYGYAWFTMLYYQLQQCARGFHVFSEILTPLAALIEHELLSWIDSLTTPNRNGWHANTAFSLKLIIEASAYGCFASLFYPAIQKSLDMYHTDSSLADDLEEHCPFLSPSLCEADLMLCCLDAPPSPDYINLSTAHLTPKEWFDQAMGMGHMSKQSQWETVYQPSTQGDPADGYMSHLCGLNFSRAWNFANIAACMLADDIADAACHWSSAAAAATGQTHEEGTAALHLISTMHQLAVQHFNYAVPCLASGHFMGDHWLASFAVRASEALSRLQMALEVAQQWQREYMKLQPDNGGMRGAQAGINKRVVCVCD
jgi:hypothetical protein